MAKDYVTVSELNQLASNWGVVHILSTLAIIGNVILNYKFKLREHLQISEGQISDCSEVISETQVQLFR